MIRNKWLERERDIEKGREGIWIWMNDEWQGRRSVGLATEVSHFAQFNTVRAPKKIAPREVSWKGHVLDQRLPVTCSWQPGASRERLRGTLFIFSFSWLLLNSLCVLRTHTEFQQDMLGFRMGSWDMLPYLVGMHIFLDLGTFPSIGSLQAERIIRHFRQMWFISPRIWA